MVSSMTGEQDEYLDSVRLHKAKHYKNALKEAERQLLAEPGKSAALEAKVRALLGLGRPQEARTAAEELAARRPGDISFSLLMGHIWLGLEDIQSAAKCFMVVLELQPKNEEAFGAVVSMLKQERGPLAWLGLAKMWIYDNGFPGLMMVFLTGNILLGLVAFFVPIAASLNIFGFLWIANPLINSILRFMPRGRAFVTSKEITASNFVIGAFLSLAILMTLHHVSGAGILRAVALMLALMTFPIAASLDAASPLIRRVLSIFGFSLLGFGLLAAAPMEIYGRGSLERGYVSLALGMGLGAYASVAVILYYRAWRAGGGVINRKIF